jgi:hypothetical protein
MADQYEYGKPRRLNSVSITLILIGLAFAYFMWIFFPAYLDAWTVDHTLREAASKVYRANRLSEPDRTQTLNDIVNTARSDLKKRVGITDPDLTVSLEILENDASMTAEYKVIISHPVTTKRTTLHFKRTEHADIKAVKWD